jgi:hypothetical protein
MGLAPIYEAIFIKEEFTLARIGSGPILTELVTGLPLKDCFSIQASFVHDHAYLSAESVHVSDLRSGFVFNCKVHLGQLQAPPHQAMIVVSKISKIG